MEYFQTMISHKANKFSIDDLEDLNGLESEYMETKSYDLNSDLEVVPLTNLNFDAIERALEGKSFIIIKSIDEDI
ncbi:CLUMA_CG005905, isoform A [Clunio marinus]|uniref:CLUMA_CG005905, isoform A n=1 Tax=Clunio marinus TaxID=568069 RepID=A0A1J1I0I2_9DIPT|nr:CLUMA_CG005905, isoform A [Clunio marinus]